MQHTTPEALGAFLMSEMAAERALNSKLVIDLLQEHGGEYPFSALLDALQEKGLDASQSRELIWQTLAQSSIEFTPDRSALRMLPSHEGRVA
jgi:hypothetical protein